MCALVCTQFPSEYKAKVDAWFGHCKAALPFESVARAICENFSHIAHWLTCLR
jgi:hypothetical protein